MKQPRPAVWASVDPEVDRALEAFCLQHGLSRAAATRMALDGMLTNTASPWWIGYAEGFRSAQHDLQPALEGLLARLREASQAANEYASAVRAQTAMPPA
jgi:hypothetical protein